MYMCMSYIYILVSTKQFVRVLIVFFVHYIDIRVLTEQLFKIDQPSIDEFNIQPNSPSHIVESD